MKQVQTLHENWQFRQQGTESWYPAQVPGVVHTDLLANGLIEDPFYGTNEETLQWIENENWEYRTVFSVSGRDLRQGRIELVFEGLDTYATIFVNGKAVLEADNMFREWRVACNSVLQAGENELRILFRSPVKEDLPKKERLPYELPAGGDHGAGTSVFARKAPYHFGWDWGPRFVTAGVWRPVRLERWSGVRIREVRLRQEEVRPEKAVLGVTLELEADRALEGELRLAVNPGKVPEVRRSLRLEPGRRRLKLTLTVPEPELWYPRGYGEQPLYTVTATVYEGGAPADAASLRTGLRSLNLRRRPDEWGESFQFEINGIPVFAKGANWIPADSFPPRVTEARYRELLQAAADANMNMIRVWGGGIYESDRFYELCDELGLLVWQDFMFACGLYPGDSGFLANVAEEARYQIRRLHHHPSIVIWCGNNEIEQGWVDWNWGKHLPESVWKDYLKLFYDLLPEVCAQEDPDRPYWPSSPSSELKDEPNSQKRGDVHYWGVWHFNKPFESYLEQHPRFMTEFGFQSFPELKTVRAYAPESDWDIESPTMTVHQKHPRGNQLIRDTMRRYYPEPRDFDAFLYLSQVQQAEAIKLGAEHLRRIRPRCMGSLFWQLDDCWPVASWSSIDYFGRWKALHYYARRFYSPLLVSPVLNGEELQVFVVSDLLEESRGVLRLALFTLAGEPLWQHEGPVTVPPLSNGVHFRASLSSLTRGRRPSELFFHAEFRRGKELLSRNLLLFAPFKELALPEPGLQWRFVPGGREYRVQVSAENLALGVELLADQVDGRFSDNFFYLLPGEIQQVSFLPAGRFEAEAFQAGLRARSLVDAF